MASSTTSALGSGSGFKMGGLVSGFDTQSMVEQMSAGTKKRINKQQQAIDLLSWKQNSYRGVIDKLNKFKESYFSFTSSTNLKSNALLNAFKAESSNSRVKVTAGSGSGTNQYTIHGAQKATSAEFNTSGNQLVSGAALDLSEAKEGREYHIEVTLDGLTKQLAFKGGATEADTQANLQKALNDPAKGFGTVVVPGTGTVGRFNVSTDNKVTLNTSDPGVSHTFTIDYDYKFNATLGRDDAAEDVKATLAALGITSQVSNKVSKDSKLDSLDFNTPLVGNSFEFSINGKAFTFQKSDSIRDVLNAVNRSGVGVTMDFDQVSQKFSLKNNDSGEGTQMEIKQTSGNLLTSIFGTGEIGAGTSIGGASFKSSTLAGKSFVGSNFGSLRNSEFSFTVNGKTATIGLWGYDNIGNKITYDDVKDDNGQITSSGASQVVDMMNQELSKAFGANAPVMSYDGLTGSFSFKAASGSTVALNGGNSTGSDALSVLGFSSGQTNAVSGSSKLADLMPDVENMELNFAGATAPKGKITSTMTIDEFNTAYEGYAKIDKETGLMSISKELDTVTDADKTEKFFGTDYADLKAASAALATNTNNSKTKYGTSATITISVNGGAKTTVASSTNDVTISDTKINISDLSEADLKELNGTPADGTNPAVAGKPITINTSRDTTKAFEAIVKFVDDYNTLITDLNTEINTFRPTSNGKLNGTKYEPLTEEEKAEMSDKEIENWEEKAQKGLLYNDEAITSTLSRMRSAMNTFVNQFGLKDMGITVNKDYNEHGKLVLTEDSLRAAFNSNPEKIAELFMGTNGLAAGMESAINYATSTDATSTGRLIMQAGAAGTRYASNNAISRQLDNYTKRISELKIKYKAEQDRYWQRFSAMETQLSRIADQSASLSQFSGQ